jgi:membrane-bound metal-dependent hydrolase YbcI (DUF457 family)
MARTHAISGAAGWLVEIALVVPAADRPSWPVVGLGAVVAAGAALLPDVDHPSSCVAWTFGAPSRWACRRIARMCALIHAATKTPQDRRDADGHRTLSHTVLFAVALGGAVGLLCAPVNLLGRISSAAVTFCCTGLAARSGLPIRIKGAFGSALSGAIAAAATVWLGLGGWWLGVAVGFGCLAHLAGDSLTNSGVPAFFPLKLGGRRWRSIGAPRALRFSTGGPVEAVVWWVCAVAMAGSAWLLVI